MGKPESLPHKIPSDWSGSERVTRMEPESFGGKFLWMLGKSLPEITNTKGDISLGLTGA